MRTLAISVLAAGLVVLTPRAASAQRTIDSEPQWWHLAFAQGAIDRPWLYYLEAQPRLGASSGLVLMRSALGLELTEGLSIWAGFAWVPTWAYDAPSPALNEGRLFQQLVYADSAGPLKLTSRTRFEQRRLASAEALSLRARTLLRGALPLDDAEQWSGILWDEVFFHLNSVEGGPTAGFDQNRAFLGVGRKLSKNLTVEVGYLNNFIRRPASASDRMIHALYTFTVFNYL